MLSESLSGGEEAAGERGRCDEANPSSCAVQRWLAPATAPLPGLGYPPIFIAAALDDARLLLELLDRGANASAIGPFAGVRPLHFAAEVDAASAASILCPSGASANAAKSTGATPIHIAAQLGNAGVLRVLLSEECGGDPNLLLLGDTTPLHLAADAGETEAVAILLSAGAQKDFVMPLRGQVGPPSSVPESTTRVSSSAWIPGSHPSGPGWQSGNGATALHAAAERGHAETVRVLLDADAAHLPSMGGQTPLVTALLHRRPATARVLLEVASQRSDPCAPLHDRSAAQVARSMGYGNLARAIAGRCGP